ncbi:MAG: nitric oxide reductase [Nitrospirota bacterium]
MAGIAFIKWASSGMGSLGLAFGLLLSAVFLMWLGYMLPKARMLLIAVGFFTLLSGTFASYSNWLPQVRGEVPTVEPAGAAKKAEDMTTQELADKGEMIIFGEMGTLHGQGKGQCPLCHGFQKGALSERAPNLSGIPMRAAERIKDARYLKPDSVKTESFAGSGRATSAIEYIAESHACPNCFIVAGYGVKGSNDRESPMPEIHKGAIGLTIDEMIAVDIWMFVREGEEAPAVADLRAAYEKFIPESERKAPEPEVAGGAPAGPPIAMGTDSPEQMIKKMGCAGCHAIPGTEFTTGAVGPVLAEKMTSVKRLASAEYKARVKEGKAHAKTPKEYVIESIMNPSAFVVPMFAFGNPNQSMMPPDFSKKFTYEAVEKLADFLLQQDEAAAAKSNIKMDADGKKG